MDKIAIDIETYDPCIHEGLGCGAIRHKGMITCVGLYDGHDSIVVRPDDPRLKDWLASEDTKIFHNGVYDTDWLINGYGYKINGRIEDTMTREGLINEYYPHYTLEACCERHKVAGKNYAETVQTWYDAHGFKGKAIEHMDQVPFEIQAKYCEQDVKATWELFHKQEPIIIQNALQKVNTLECSLYPILWLLRSNGIRLDEAQRDALAGQTLAQLNALTYDIHEHYGLENIASSKQVGACFNRLGIQTPLKTKNGNDSWDHKALAQIDHPLAEQITRAKRLQNQVNTLTTKLVENCINGRLHPTFYPTQREAQGAMNGTLTGRFSCANPNLQNIASIPEKGGQEMRALFLPEEGKLLAALDYKQIEYRVFVSLAKGAGSDEARDMVRRGVDFHKVAQELTGITERALVKAFNFGVLYGMGLDTMRKDRHKEFKEAAQRAGQEFIAYTQNVYNTYITKMPFVRATALDIQQEIARVGYMYSLGQRLLHRPPKAYSKRTGKLEWKDYVMVNHLVQGSAADIVKIAMSKAYCAGCFDYMTLHLQVHDELVVSVDPSPAGLEALQELKNIMENALTLNVPLGVDVEVGPTWGYWKDDIWKIAQETGGKQWSV